MEISVAERALTGPPWDHPLFFIRFPHGEDSNGGFLFFPVLVISSMFFIF